MMIIKRLQKIVLIVCGMIISLSLIADEKVISQQAEKKTVFDVFRGISAEELTFVEDGFSLPVLNAQTRWVAFDAGLHSRANRFYLAIDNVNQGKKDRIFRYVVKFVTPGGAENIRFEGLQCLLKVYKVYAFGNPDGTWVNSTSPHWQDIERHVRNGYQAELYDAFCQDNKRRTIEQIRRQFEEDMRLVE